MNQPQRLITFHAGLSDFAPAAMRLVRKGPELAIEDRVFVITSANIDQLVGELVEVDWPREGGPTSIETVRTSRQWIIERAVQTSLSAQRIALFPVRITTPEAGIHWQKDVAHGLVAQSLKSLVDSPKPIPEMADDAIRRDVADVVLVSIERLADHIRVHELADVRDGILARDASLADELERIGANGKKLAAKVRKQAKQRSAKPGDVLKLYEPWLPDGFLERDPVGGLPWIRALGRAAWLDVVQPRRKRIERKPAALVYTVHEAVTDVLTKTTKTETPSGQRMIAFPGVPLVDGDALTEVQARGVELLRTRTSFRLMNWLVAAGHTRAIHEIPDPRMLTIDGSWNAIAESLGMTSKRAPDELRAIAEALSVAQVPLPTGERRALLMLRDAEAATGRRQSSIKIILGPELLPDYVFEMMNAMPKGRLRDEAARLVPMIGNVPVTGARQTYGAQEGLAMLFVRELRAHARELLKSGLVPVPDRRWAELAKQVRLPDATLPKVLDRWAHDGDDAPALLIREGDRYTLADSHAPAREFIADAGKHSEAQAVRGRQRVSRKGRPARRRSE